jgi:LmbE family N-acetylglucosaminyl deacetylase
MSRKRMLVVAPHPDDEALGAGGTIARFADEGDEVTVLFVSGHLPPLYDAASYEETVRESRRACTILGARDPRFLGIAATTVTESRMNGDIAAIIAEVEPHVVLCPYPDRHIDHRAVFSSVMVAARPTGPGRGIELLAAYETLSETHWNAPHIEPNFVPNWVVNITDHIDRKCGALSCYASQIPTFPGARSVEAIRALAMFRGTQAGFGFGEAFHIIRMTR